MIATRAVLRIMVFLSFVAGIISFLSYFKGPSKGMKSIYSLVDKIPETTLMSTPKATEVKKYIPSGQSMQSASTTRVYQPKISSNNPNTTSAVVPSYNRVLSPSPNNIRSDFDRNRRPSTTNLILENPQLLIRFRVPKIVSDYKLELQGLQSSYLAQSEQYKPRSSDDKSRGTGNRDSFFDNFVPPPVSTSFDSTRRGVKGKTGSGAKEADRKLSEGKPKTSTKRGANGEPEDDYETYDDDGDLAEGSPDYYGDEENVSLSSISAGTLIAYEQEGLSLEDIQLSLYGEYGIKASLNAIKRRLQDDKMEKKGRKKTGKTRKDRTKARNARLHPVREVGVTLPETGSIPIRELASLLELGAGEVIKHLMLNEGVMVTLTQSIDVGVARRVAVAFGKKVAESNADGHDAEDDEDDTDVSDTINDHDVVVRPPVVTIMGHVDHGKTSLLDSIRSARVALGEAGGITQGISAFKVKTSREDTITFIDTPGHAAFSDMRIRGANITDIVVLVVAADDGVMEQTKECIAAAKAAGCPIVVAINKIDKEGADPNAIKTQLMSYDVLVEEFGGDAQCVLVSATKGIGLAELLEKIQIQAEVMNLRTSEDAPGVGSVVEARVDKGLGVVVTTLVQKGTIKVGDVVLAGPSWGRVRRLVADDGLQVQSAGPSTPIQIIGMNGVPNAGDQIAVVFDEAAAKETAESRKRLVKQAVGLASSATIMSNAVGFADGLSDNREVIKIPLLIKSDVLGSAEALRNSIEALQISDEAAICKADIIYSNVGDVTSSDVSIAAAAKAKIIAFNVASGYNAMEDARASNVEIGYYNVIYELIEELKEQIQVALAPPPPGTFLGRLTIKKVFKLGKAGKIAGCEVTEGIVRVDSKVRVLRGKRNVIYTGSISSLKVVKDDVREVPLGSECGLSLVDYSDFEDGDILECFSIGNNDEG